MLKGNHLTPQFQTDDRKSQAKRCVALTEIWGAKEDSLSAIAVVLENEPTIHTLRFRAPHETTITKWLYTVNVALETALTEGAMEIDVFIMSKPLLDMLSENQKGKSDAYAKELLRYINLSEMFSKAPNIIMKKQHKRLNTALAVLSNNQSLIHLCFQDYLKDGKIPEGKELVNLILAA